MFGIWHMTFLIRKQNSGYEILKSAWERLNHKLFIYSITDPSTSLIYANHETDPNTLSWADEHDFL